MTEIFKKLNEARKAFHKIDLKKSGENKFQKYKYFELADFVKPALEVMNEAGLCAVVSFTESIATMQVFETEGNGNVEITSPMASANLKGCHPVQNIGAVETYQRRYLWMALLEIIEHDALDSSEGVNDNQQAKASSGGPSGFLLVDDDKPWYNDLNKHFRMMDEQVKSGEKTPEEIIANLCEKFKVSKDDRNSIKNITRN